MNTYLSICPKSSKISFFLQKSCIVLYNSLISIIEYPNALSKISGKAYFRDFWSISEIWDRRNRSIFISMDTILSNLSRRLFSTSYLTQHDAILLSSFIASLYWMLLIHYYHDSMLVHSHSSTLLNTHLKYDCSSLRSLSSSYFIDSSSHIILCDTLFIIDTHLQIILEI